MDELPDGLEWGPWFITWGQELFFPQDGDDAREPDGGTEV